MSAEREIDMYRALVGGRIAEQAIVDLNEKGVLHDHHSGLGHEAIGVGVGFAVRPDDAVQASHRSGMMLAHARGGSLAARRRPERDRERVPPVRADSGTAAGDPARGSDRQPAADGGRRGHGRPLPREGHGHGGVLRRRRGERGCRARGHEPGRRAPPAHGVRDREQRLRPQHAGQRGDGRRRARRAVRPATA